MNEMLGGGLKDDFYIGKWSNLTTVFQLGWNHDLGKYDRNTVLDVFLCEWLDYVTRTCPNWPRHKISAELGQFHEESSFYQALHNGTVRGTCMILDEKACGKENGPGILGWFLRWRWNRFFMSSPFLPEKQVNWITFDHGWDTSSSPDALVRSCVGTSSDGWWVD